MREAGSFVNVDTYKAVREIAWLYNQSGQSEQAAIRKYAQEKGCTEKTAAKFLALAKQNRNRVPFYQTVQDEDSEKTAKMSAGKTAGTMRRFSGTAFRPKLSEKRLKS